HLAEDAHRPTRSHRALDDDSEKPGVREDVTDLLGAERHSVPDESPLREERESSRERGERESEEEELPEQPTEEGTAEILHVCAPVEDAQPLPTWGDRRFFLLGRPQRHGCRHRALPGGVRWYGRQQERRPESAREGEPGRTQDRHVEAVVRREIPGDARTDQEADAE